MCFLPKEVLSIHLKEKKKDEDEKEDDLKLRYMEQLIEVILQQQIGQPASYVSLETQIANHNELNDDGRGDEEDDDESSTGRKRKRNRIADPSSWKRNKNALLREHGQSYYGIKTTVDEQGRKCLTEVPRAGRRLRARCECKSTAFECKKISDEMRQHLFDEFWALDWTEKRSYMNRLVTLGCVKRPRHRKEADRSRRTKSLKYFFEYGASRFRVCKTMFLGTFDLSQWSVHGWQRKLSSVVAGEHISADVDCLLSEPVGDGSYSWFDDFLTYGNIQSHESESDLKKRKAPRKRRSNLTNEMHYTDDTTTSESEADNFTVESTTISFVDVASLASNSGSEKGNVSPAVSESHLECELSTKSDLLTSEQPDVRQMLMELSRRMDEMQEKFETRLQSLETQIRKISEHRCPDIPHATQITESSSSDVESLPDTEQPLVKCLAESKCRFNNGNVPARVEFSKFYDLSDSRFLLEKADSCAFINRNDSDLSHSFEEKPLILKANRNVSPKEEMKSENVIIC